MDFLNFINKDSLILVAVIYALGMMLKGIKKIPDYLIPFMLLALATGLSIGINGLNIGAFIQAVLIVAVAVYTNQLFKQTIEGISPKTEIPETPKEINPTGTTTNDIK